MHRRIFFATLAALTASAALAQSTPKAPPAPYSIPWQLRPTAAANVLRSDTAFAFFQAQDGTSGFTGATFLLGSYKVINGLAPMVRLGFVGHSPPSGGTGAATLLNPVIGATYAMTFGEDLRLGAFLGLTVPLGLLSGGASDPALLGALRGGILSRSAMDNAMFRLNDLTVFPGIGLAYVKGGLTVQAELTILQLTKVAGAAPDASNTNLTSGIHVGYFVLPQLSLGVELRHQRWLVPPTGTALAALHNTTVAVGARFHLKLSDTLWIRPGLAYATALDDPMRASSYQIVQLDVPVSF